MSSGKQFIINYIDFRMKDIVWDSYQIIAYLWLESHSCVFLATTKQLGLVM